MSLCINQDYFSFLQNYSEINAPHKLNQTYHETFLPISPSDCTAHVVQQYKT